MIKKRVLIFILTFGLIFTVQGIAKKKRKAEASQFKIITKVKTTPPKDQGKTGTCWCFSTTSFLESELLRMGKGEYDLSEMFTVRNNYLMKAVNYIRLHGNATFGQGGQAHHVFKSIKKYGIVPESVYPGLGYGGKKHNHSELFRILKGFLNNLIVNRWGATISSVWFEAYQKILDTYLGKYPEKFKYNGKRYTPKSFLDYLGINPDDYVEFTSYDLYPFYKKVRLEVPDNWDFDSNYYNVPIDELEKIVGYALKHGYSVVWDGDISEGYFSSRKAGLGVVPKDWDKTPPDKRDKLLIPSVKEKDIDQKMRRETFLTFETTDDHLMHIVGIAKSKSGKKFYYVKNSGGTKGRYKGFLYLSKAFFRLKTIAVTLHKNAIPPEVKEKIGPISGK